MNWIKGYEPGDLVWLNSPGMPTIAGTVVNRSKTEVFVRTNYQGKDLYLAVDVEGNIEHRERDQVLTMAGMVINKK
jgi:hypothetical protein